ncbi:MAG: uroporphyrinogen-III C-methyltransferase [Chloroflexi bacterium]|nr:uroporphyrinogen-III C-methyltransferase [Chloroflexota bacterium]
MSAPGKVFLVGAGPGDPGLITAKGLRLLRQAQVVVYDRLVNERLVGEAPPEAERIYVGKWPRRDALSQEEINQVLVAKGREGKRVVRLKGGDPFVFGRGGEEVEALVEAGIPFEVVPGVTSAIAVPAYAGIPLTHRKVASSFTVVSGSEDPSKPESAIDWGALASGSGTLVVLMGWESLPQIVETLVRHGKAPDTPVALVQDGTGPCQRTVTGTLADIVARAREEGLVPPVVAVIGEVARFRQRFRWFDTSPLFGKRVLVTRSRVQASALSEMLIGLGAEPVELSTIEVRPLEDASPLDAALGRLGQYCWVVFTSANGVEAAFNRLAALGKDARAFGQARVCAIGPATAQALRGYGVRADYVPEQYTSEAVAAGLGSRGLNGERVLLLRTDIEGEPLAEGLARLGAQAEQAVAYRTATPAESAGRARELLAGGKIDVATFTSSSTVRNLLDLLAGDASPLQGVTVACIGPVTARTARKLGLRVDVEAKVHTIQGLVEALAEHFESGGR